MRVGFIYSPVFLQHETPRGHPECKERLIAIMHKLESTPEVFSRLVPLPPRKATTFELEAVHSTHYVEKIFTATPGYLDGDTFLSRGSCEASLYAAGAILTAIDACEKQTIHRAFCAVRPPGHHAERDRAMGFCIFNNIAVGAAYALRHGFKRVFIIDFDVHHGNGTQHIFYHSSDVYYFSTHQFPHYPGSGTQGERGEGEGSGYTCNIPMYAYTGDDEYVKIYQEILPRAVKSFNPDLILVSAGYDILDCDPLSSVRVSNDGIKNIVEGILSSKHGVPVIFALEGGYNLEGLANAVLTTCDTLLNHK